MVDRTVESDVLRAYGILPGTFSIIPIGNGNINKTFRVETPGQSFVLQRINTSVFVQPEVIASNLEYVGRYLSEKHPDYLFISPLPSLNGNLLTYDSSGFPWRLYPYKEGTYTVDDVQNIDQAREAAIAFARFGRLLKDCDVSKVRPTIPRFHDLSLRFEQFVQALEVAPADLKIKVSVEIDKMLQFKIYVEEYESMIKSNVLKPGIFHNDTKINNILFDRDSGKAVAVIDLDTVMEGYFIYDLGDLLRTLVSPVSEEEQNLELVTVRKEFYDAVVDGYMSEMGPVFSPKEVKLARFAGIMMTYIMGLRFLADYLRGNTYYRISYPEQNLVRARNQLKLIEEFRRM